jgi:hypothetical protein
VVEVREVDAGAEKAAEGGRLGILSCEADPSYPDKLDRWTTWAAERGMYTIFKMTTYDVPDMTMGMPGASGAGRSSGRPAAGAAFNPVYWQAFWDRDDWRANRIDAWRIVWERFAGRSEVAGYDILNEPFIGSTPADYVNDHLYPFYESVSAALRKLDTEVPMLVQPCVGVRGGLGHFPGAEDTPNGPQPKLNDPVVVYAPHYYPALGREITSSDYDHYYAGFRAEAEQVGGALAIGEYGLPNMELPLPTRVVIGMSEILIGLDRENIANRW